LSILANYKYLEEGTLVNSMVSVVLYRAFKGLVTRLDIVIVYAML
jgi:hypothetical protein